MNEQIDGGSWLVILNNVIDITLGSAMLLVAVVSFGVLLVIVANAVNDLLKSWVYKIRERAHIGHARSVARF